MQIVIDIPKVLYERIENAELVIVNMGRGNGKSSSTTDLSIILNAIQNGVVLPEHHGRLIDSSKMVLRFNKNINPSLRDNIFRVFKDMIDNAPTVLEGSVEECKW